MGLTPGFMAIHKLLPNNKHSDRNKNIDDVNQQYQKKGLKAQLENWCFILGFGNCF